MKYNIGDKVKISILKIKGGNEMKKFGFEVVDYNDTIGNESYVFSFKNGYGASVIKKANISGFMGSYGGSYGFENDNWEIAVLKDGYLCYNTYITDDVLGDITEENVTEILEQIKKL